MLFRSPTLNDMSLSVGIGNTSGISIVQLGLLDLISSSPNFTGMKIHRNGKLVLNSADNLIFNTLRRIQLYADSIDFVSANINTSGKLAKKAPIYFTTNRTFTMNAKSYLAYDIDLSLYTNKVDLDGFSHRHFRVKIFFGIGRVEFQ